jgi:cytochrome c
MARSLPSLSALALLWLALVATVFAGETRTPPAVTPTPTVDRLAAPPTVENPGQADEGAQLYWLNCQPCHGDRGQGLTDEWRAQYPPEDQNCWGRGCHGERPYENGFTLPQQVPAVIGEGSLTRFQTAGQLYDFVRAAMPYQAPGSLSDEEYLAITAFLARAQGMENGRSLRADTVAEVPLRPQSEATPDPHREAEASPVAAGQLWLLVLILPIVAGGLWLWRHSQRSKL